jgi:polyhydroxybutyrate depolymerase
MRHGYAFALVAILVSGCTSSPSGHPGSPGTAGTGSGSGGTGGVGPGPTAGSGGTSPGGGGAGSSGAAGSIAGGGTGGTATGGSGGGAGTLGAGGAGGAQGGGGQGGGQAGGSTGGAGSSAAAPSAGCGKSGRPAGGVVTVANDHIYNFPTSYDGTKPMPLVIALHGANNSNTSLQGLSNGSRLETNFVRAFPKSNTAAWVFGGGTGADSQRITTIYNELLASYCIDTRRVFLTGHSSGAQMSVQMVCAAGGDKRFKAVAPVAASKYCNQLTPIPVMYIQGMMDAMRGNSDGANVVAVFTASNTCTTSTLPYTAVAACNSTLDGKPVNPGCIAYQGCSQPTIWCSHNDNGYNLTDGHEHGWPCFASNAMADFFLSLP